MPNDNTLPKNSCYALKLLDRQNFILLDKDLCSTLHIHVMAKADHHLAYFMFHRLNLLFINSNSYLLYTSDMKGYFVESFIAKNLSYVIIVTIL